MPGQRPLVPDGSSWILPLRVPLSSAAFSFVLSFFFGFRRPKLITGLSGWRSTRLATSFISAGSLTLLPFSPFLVRSITRCDCALEVVTFHSDITAGHRATGHLPAPNHSHTKTNTSTYTYTHTHPHIIFQPDHTSSWHTKGQHLLFTFATKTFHHV